jgi:peptide-methionine (S)-S-oxide reductase
MGETDKFETATLGGGCFWCVEAVFQHLKGVKRVVSGYAGGHVSNPTYKQICTGTTGHAEVVQIEFDPGEISYADLLQLFWKSHDPTTLNRQGADAGTQYRSIILYHSETQKKIAEQSRAEAARDFADPIVTQLVPFTIFHPAEDYHQNYFRDNPGAPYCMYVIRPKMMKLGML